jgi:4-hydroxy-2-oxoglutarate aldolase
MSHRSIDLDGILIPGATPFDPETGDVDVVALRANVRRWMATPVRGVVIGGSTGEAVLLDRDERRKSLDAARGVVPEDRLLVAGTGAESTRMTLALTRDAAQRGADAVLVQPPAFYKGAMTPEVLREHYLALADDSPVPVILYQVPLRFSTLELPSGLIGELSEHPNVVGVKDSRGDLGKLAEYVTGSRDDFQVLVGSGSALYASLEVGATGGILGVANLVPGWTAELHQAFRSGDQSRAGALQEKVAPLHNGIIGAMGVPGVKFALDRLGYHGGEPRRPLRSLAAPGQQKVEELLTAAELLGQD